MRRIASKKGISRDLEKTWGTLVSVLEILHFLGLGGFYRELIPNVPHIKAPCRTLLNKSKMLKFVLP